MLNIVIPMAGEGSRFKVAGYSDPKPMIKLNNKRMIELVINNIKPNRKHRFIFICQSQHLNDTELEQVLKRASSDCIILSVDKKTGGAAETVLKAEEYINNEAGLMIANCDQWIDVDINDYLGAADGENVDGMIMTMTANDEKWSFLRLDECNRVVEVREKEVISNEASVGIYNFKRGKDFCSAARRMIKENNRSMGEYYVAPVYNYLIKENSAVIGHYNIGEEFKGMYGLGVPKDLECFMNNDLLIEATNF
ncbi:glycosyltransferase family 2 protein [Rosenbergiella nectarea]|uniref:glycosyltransferase family 2 protein n=1 Tax=Rosenbergiella nectarea TaxID=988801 RepID=UPI001F4EBBF9|nr:glycosyltransferase family 2 protein [Rosenbergiella nectarea]